MTKDKSEHDVNLQSEDFKIKDYKDYSVDELKYHMLTRINTMPIEDKAKKQLMSNIEKFPNNASPEQIKELNKAAIVLDIIQATVFDHASEVLKGGHVMIKDEGKLYDALVEKGIVKERHSSHHNANKVEGKRDVSLQGGEIFKEFLVGKTKDGKTWFQLEAHSMGGIKNFIGHMIDYIKYKISGKNVGQYGLSAHIDSNPIEVTKNQAREKMAGVKEKYDIQHDTKVTKRQKAIDKKYMKISTNKSEGRGRI